MEWACVVIGSTITDSTAKTVASKLLSELQTAGDRYKFDPKPVRLLRSAHLASVLHSESVVRDFIRSWKVDSTTYRVFFIFHDERFTTAQPLVRSFRSEYKKIRFFDIDANSASYCLNNRSEKLISNFRLCCGISDIFLPMIKSDSNADINTAVVDECEEHQSSSVQPGTMDDGDKSTVQWATISICDPNKHYKERVFTKQEARQCSERLLREMHPRVVANEPELELRFDSLKQALNQSECKLESWNKRYAGDQYVLIYCSESTGGDPYPHKQFQSRFSDARQFQHMWFFSLNVTQMRAVNDNTNDGVIERFRRVLSLLGHIRPATPPPLTNINGVGNDHSQHGNQQLDVSNERFTELQRAYRNPHGATCGRIQFQDDRYGIIRTNEGTTLRMKPDDCCWEKTTTLSSYFEPNEEVVFLSGYTDEAGKHAVSVCPKRKLKQGIAIIHKVDSQYVFAKPENIPTVHIFVSIQRLLHLFLPNETRSCLNLVNVGDKFVFKAAPIRLNTYKALEVRLITKRQHEFEKRLAGYSMSNKNIPSPSCSIGEIGAVAETHNDFLPQTENTANSDQPLYSIQISGGSENYDHDFNEFLESVKATEHDNCPQPTQATNGLETVANDAHEIDELNDELDRMFQSSSNEPSIVQQRAESVASSGVYPPVSHPQLPTTTSNNNLSVLPNLSFQASAPAAILSNQMMFQQQPTIYHCQPEQQQLQPTPQYSAQQLTGYSIQQQQPIMYNQQLNPVPGSVEMPPQPLPGFVQEPPAAARPFGLGRGMGRGLKMSLFNQNLPVPPGMIPVSSVASSTSTSTSNVNIEHTQSASPQLLDDKMTQTDTQLDTLSDKETVAFLLQARNVFVHCHMEDAVRQLEPELHAILFAP